MVQQAVWSDARLMGVGVQIGLGMKAYKFCPTLPFGMFKYGHEIGRIAVVCLSI